uniref:Acetyl-coenzyme A carboxylase carboxyl transferase subunit beta n=1 Tax=Vincetoxicum pingtaoanum TaxID=2980749 RepID=A0A977LLP8_9GENT|nr:acetyl-CoA carboxylase carboxyltransferase beta subunit [Vincetoxicum pingtaoanum]UXG54605.1 acetyl-CoA carboxylase carboxyltransferase beta subunit [Vincetoxicum pingtaoanum]
MERWWFNSMLFKKELERKCGLNKSMDSLGPIENTGEIEDSNRKDTTKNIQSRDDSSYSNVDSLFGVKDIRNFISNVSFLVKDRNGDSYSIYFDSENQIFEIDNNPGELESSFGDSSYLHNESTSEDTCSNNDTQYSWNNYLNSCIESYLQSEIRIATSMVGDIDNCSDSYIYRHICGESRNNGETEGWDGEIEGWDGEIGGWDGETEGSDGETEGSDVEIEGWDGEIEGCDGEMEGSDGETEGSAGIRTHAQESDLILEDSFNDIEDSFNDIEAQDSDLILEDSFNDIEDSSNDTEDSFNDTEDSFKDSFNDTEDSSNDIDAKDSDLTLEDSSNDREVSSNHTEDSSNDTEDSSNDNDETDDNYEIDPASKFRHLWVQCDNCYGLNYKRFFISKLNICEHCEWHLKMNSSDRIELSIDPDTWDPMDEDMVSLDPIEFQDEPPYKDRLDAYQATTGLPEAIQTGIGELNGIPVAVGFMDFEFMGGSMGSVVGEKITRLIEYATNHFLPLIIVCASGGARMQEGSVSLMQMAKISSALHEYQLNKKLFYISILASPTTGGVTASFGMLGDIIIAEPNAYIAFAGKRVIEQTLNIEVPEGSQETEPLFEKGLFDLIVPRKFLKSVLTELLKLHAFFPLTKNANQN